jgi:hypothetical protein
MNANDIYRNLKSCNSNNTFFGVLPSYALKHLKHFKMFKKRTYMILTNISYSPFNSEACSFGHYIVIIDCFSYFEIFDPLGISNNDDENIISFIKKNNCVINLTHCQNINSKMCSIYCMFYLECRSSGLTRDQSLKYLRLFSN